MLTTRPNIQPIVAPEHAWRHAKERSGLLHGKLKGLMLALTAAAPTVAVLWVLGKNEDMKVGIITTLATWGALALAVLAQLFWHRLRAPGEILAERLTNANAEFRELQLEIETLKTERERLAAQRSDLRPAYNEIKFGAGTAAPPDGSAVMTGAFVMLVVAVRNVGAVPSAVGGYEFYLKFPDGRLLKGDGQAIPNQLVVDTIMGRKDSMVGEDHLPAKTTHPIPQGGLTQGRLVYFFRDADVHSLVFPGVSLVLKMRDMWDRPYEVVHVVKDGNVAPAGPSPQFPGLKPKF